MRFVPSAIAGSAVLRSWSLLQRRERRQFWALSALTIVTAILEMVALTSIVPVISLVLDASRMTSGRGISTLWRFFGEPAYNTFLIELAVASVVAIVGSSLLTLYSGHVVQKFGADWQSRLAGELMGRCLNAPYTWFLDKHTALLARLFSNDILFWWRDVINRLIQTFGSVFTLVLAVALVLTIAPIPGLVMLAATTVIAVVVFLPFQPALNRLARSNRETADAMMRTASDGMSGVKDIKVSRRQDYFAGLFTNAFDVSVHSRARVQLLNNIGPLVLVLGGQVALVAAGVSMSVAGVSAAEISVLMALLLLVASRVIPAVNRIASAVNRFTDVAPFIDDLCKAHAELTRIGHRSAAARPEPAVPLAWARVQVRGLTYAYPGSAEPVLRGASFTVERGKSYGIVGGSGAGKTTLVDVMLGLLEPSAADIRIDDVRIDNFSVEGWQRQISYVPQSPFLLSDTLSANIAFGVPPAEVDEKRLWRAVERANIAALCRELPEGMNTLIGERGVRLSGGQRQRVAIARALYAEPAILVLDEATNALDAISEQAVQQAIQSLHGDITIIVIAHRMTAVRDCDVLFLLEDGKVGAQGTYDSLLSNSAQFRRLAETGA